MSEEVSELFVLLKIRSWNMTKNFKVYVKGELLISSQAEAPRHEPFNVHCCLAKHHKMNEISLYLPTCFPLCRKNDKRTCFAVLFYQVTSWSIIIILSRPQQLRTPYYMGNASTMRCLWRKIEVRVHILHLRFIIHIAKPHLQITSA